MEFSNVKLSRCATYEELNDEWYGVDGRTDMPPVQLHDVSDVFNVMECDVFRGMHISSLHSGNKENDVRITDKGRLDLFSRDVPNGDKADMMNIIQVTMTSDDLLEFEANSKSCLVEIEDVVDGRVKLAEVRGNNSMCDDEDDEEVYNVKGVRLLNIPIEKILRLSSFFSCPTLSNTRFLRVTTIWHNTSRLEKGINQIHESLRHLVGVLQGENIDYMYRPRNYTFRCVGYEGNVDVCFTIQLFDFGSEGVAMEFVRDSDDVIRFTSILRRVKNQFEEPCVTSCKVVFTPSTNLPADTSAMSKSIVELLGSSEPVIMNEGIQLLATATMDPNYLLIATLLHLNVLTLAWNLIQSSTTDITVKRIALESIRNIAQYGLQRNLKLDIAHGNLIDIISSDYFETLRGIQLKRSAALLLKDLITREPPASKYQCVKRLQSFVPLCQDDKLLNTLHEIMV